MCAWIGLASAKQTTNENTRRARVKDALDDYANVFSADDLAFLAEEIAASSTGRQRVLEAGATMADARRRAHALVVLEAARDYNLSKSVGAHPSNEIFDRAINSPNPL